MFSRSMPLGIATTGPLASPVDRIASATSALTQIRTAGRGRNRRRGSPAWACRTCWIRLTTGTGHGSGTASQSRPATNRAAAAHGSQGANDPATASFQGLSAPRVERGVRWIRGVNREDRVLCPK